MTVSVGTRLGAYEILSLIGSGGMGEVYRARDSRLNRDVAIKALPSEVAADPDRLARFEREAQLLASLNHPNIAQIHGVDDSSGTPALVMELVEGPTLADRIAKGSIPLDEALPIAKQIAEALEAAHEQGIIHRDLKPANIKVRPDGIVKVLDFGLAKAFDPVASGVGNATMSPTLSIHGTQAGIILGTAAYMSPEQARGRAVDTRADIWAFGCVVFEMLAGQAPFPGESVTDILAKVIERDPDWRLLPRATPPPLRRLLRRCLEKEPKRRLAAVADARFELDEAAGTAAATEFSVSASHSLSLIAAATMAALVLVAGISAWGWLHATRSAAQAPSSGTYVVATLCANVPDLAALTDRFAVSTDGTLLAIVDGVRGGLLLRRTSDLDVTPIAGTPPDAYAPVFSPDGRWIAFRTDRGLMKIPTEGGRPAFLASGTDYFVNLTWGTDDRIRYPSLHNDAIRSVSANGGPIETVSFGPNVWVNRAVGLPNGRLLVSVMTERERQVAVREPDGTLRTLIAGWDARVTPTGYLLFSRPEAASWSIVAVPFDASTATIAGASAVLARDVPVRLATPAVASAAGDLFYVAGGPRSDRRVVIADRRGAEHDVAVPSGAWLWQSISPDGQRLALGRWEGARRTIWTLALDTGALTQVTYLDDTFSSEWMPDGKRIVFSQFPIDPALRATSIWSVLTDGRGKIEPVAAQWDAYPGAVSSDGRTLYYSANQSEQAQEDIVSVSLTAAAPKPVVLLATPASERMPMPSNDGRWLAYETNASGSVETRVAPLADLSTSIQVSTRGGSPVRWSPDSSRFYYTDGDAIHVVDVGTRGPMLTSRRGAFSLPSDWRGRLDVMPDGEHAVMIRGGLIYSDIVVMQGALVRGKVR
jgi:Tol biopolymer transport system component